MAGIFDFLFGSDDKTEQLPSMSPEQTQFLQQLMQMLGGEGQLGQGQEEALSGLRELMDPSSAAQQRFADPYMQQFQQQTIPGIAEQFAGAGGGALSSSGFGQALGSASAGLQSQLAQLKSGLQQQSAQDIMGQFQNLSQQGLGAQPFGYQHKQGSQGALGSALGGFAGAGFPGLF
tara:strand:+ start:11631 stop:12158 length:528 start_codon:yes stop_codon:yes gene_type:complete